MKFIYTISLIKLQKMASLYVLKKISSKFNFRPIQTSPELIISGISKLYIEHLCLKTETTCLFVPLVGLASYSGSGELLIISNGFAIAGYILSYTIPLLRTYDAYENSTLEILDL